MMDPIYVSGGVGGVLLALIGGVWQMVTSRIEAQTNALADLQRAHTALEVKAAETYVSRETLKDMLQPIMEELRKIDRKLDEKADKE